jgi:hypothetical protein
MRRVTVGLALVLVQPGVGAATQTSTDPVTQAQTWRTESNGVALQLTQILPDQLRAFYINRGFSADDAEVFARACVFMTVLRNDAAKGIVRYRLADWTVETDGERQALKLMPQWMKEWEVRGVAQPARLAFQWAHFPLEQEYDRGDWNQGMAATGLPPSSEFTLTARWSVNGKSHRGELRHVRCAP